MSYYSQNYDESETSYISDKNVIDSLNLLRKIEETSFDRCGVKTVSEHTIVCFNYDWERTFDRYYMIYWCEDLKALKLYIQSYKDPETEYILKKLGGVIGIILVGSKK